MVNADMLRGKIAEKRTTVSELAEKMGIDKATLYRRLANGDSFSIGEARKVAEILGLSNEEAIAIFFNNIVA